MKEYNVYDSRNCTAHVGTAVLAFVTVESLCMYIIQV